MYNNIKKIKMGNRKEREEKLNYYGINNRIIQ